MAAETRYIVMFRIGDRVNYVDPHDDCIGKVIGFKYTRFAGDFPSVIVQYPGHTMTGPIDAFTFVGRGTACSETSGPLGPSKSKTATG